MSFLDYNLARMKSSSDSVQKISDRAFQSKQAGLDRFFSGLRGLAGSIGNTRAAGKLADAKVTEADATRDFEGGLVTDKAAALKASEDKMYEQYENGSYKDDITGIDYNWNNKPEFEMQLAKMKADRDRYLAKLSAGKNGEDEERIGGLFQGIMGELQGTVYRDSYDQGTGRYQNDWMLENKEGFKSSFNSLLSGYSPEQKEALNNLLDTYLSQYKPGEVADPDADSSTAKIDVYDPARLQGENYKSLSSFFPSSGDASIGDFYGVRPTAEKSVAQDINNIAGMSPTGRTLENPELWDKMISLMRRVPTQTFDDPSVRSYMKEAADGDIKPTFMESMILLLEKATVNGPR